MAVDAAGSSNDVVLKTVVCGQWIQQVGDLYGSVLLALIVGAGRGGADAVHLPRFALALPIAVLTFVVVCGESSFHRRVKRQQFSSVN